MSKKIIKVSLTERGLDNAIKELEDYKKWLKKKTEEFVKALADEGMQISKAKFESAIYDGTNDVQVSIESRGENKAAVVAIGSSVLFIEFGTGINHDDSHPEAIKNNFIHGGYGYHLGRLERGWMYEGDPGTNGEIITEGKHEGKVHTYGNPANMSMYSTVRELEEKFKEIARRVYQR